MGREAICICEWDGTAAEVKALLESNEIILRGAMRKRIPLSKMANVNQESGRLSFTVGGEVVQLIRGPAAEKWAAAIRNPPPTLAHKLGITNKVALRVIGDVCDESLNEALAEAAASESNNPNLIIACVDSPESLHAALRDSKAQLMKGVPIWMVYAKGKGHAIDETAIRSLLRENEMIDTKVASVSAKYTALRFVYRKFD